MTTAAQRLATAAAILTMSALIAHIINADPIGRLRSDLAAGKMVRSAPLNLWTCDNSRAKVCALPLRDEELE